MLQQLSALVLLGICSLEDIKTRRIHTGWLICFAAEGILFSMFMWKRSIAEIIAAMIPGFMILVLSSAAHGSIGAGDGLLLIVMGIFLEVSFVFGMMILAVFLSGGYALFLYIVRKKSRKYEIPFVPFLLLAFAGELFLEGNGYI